ncbi:NAD(P)/FAD-dependent oxidoreductase [Thermocrispum agreste]|uniref:NAD(P)/FAD-dependent oxidoreductase n=1 Tax=Thermocrispum agreste TaxID=37925 RepID=UPI0004086686|nr:FAD-dependent oxidoreductase [Thermocrispum agreste]
MTVVVAGAGLAGLRVAEELRKAGYDGELMLVGAEPTPPYDRPPLSKEVLQGRRSPAAIRLRDDAFFADHGITLRLGSRVTAVHPQRKSIVLAAGETIGYDRLVIATGLRPRTLPGTESVPGVHTLRSLDDCLALRRRLDGADSAIVVGAGFVGCEVAASLRVCGLRVHLVEQQQAPLAGVLGETLGELVARWHLKAGVDLRCGCGVAELKQSDRKLRVTLTDGAELAADVVVVGIGSVPEVSWLAGSGVEVGDGVLCDERGRTSVTDVWAVGDVAAWRGPGGRHRRTEHWTNAGEHARVVARDILGLPPDEPAVPYFWSDQYGLRLQVFGDVRASAKVRVEEDDGRRFLATCAVDGRLTAVVAAGMAGKATRLRRRIGEPVGDG